MNHTPLAQRFRRHFTARPTLRRIIENFSWLSIDNALTMLLGLLVGVWIARYLSPERFGLLNYAIAFVALWGSFASLGLNNIVVRDLLLHPNQRDEILGSAFVLLLTAGSITASIIIATIWCVRRADTLTCWLVTILAFQLIFKAFDIVDFMFQSRMESKYTVWTRNFSQLTVSLLKVGLILVGAPLIGFAWANLSGVAITGLALVVVSRFRGFSITDWTFSRARAQYLLSQSWPLIFSGTFVILNLLTDKILLRELANAHELGLFSAAARISEAWYLLPVAAGASVVPALTEAYANQPQVYRSKLQAVYDVMTAASLAIAITATFFSKPIIAILFGPAYTRSASMLAIHIWSAVFLFHVSIRTRSLIIEGKQRFVAVLSFAAMVANIAGNLLLIPRFGGVGASYASLFSWAFCALVVPLLWAQTRASVPMFLNSFVAFARLRK